MNWVETNWPRTALLDQKPSTNDEFFRAEKTYERKQMELGYLIEMLDIMENTGRFPRKRGYMQEIYTGLTNAYGYKVPPEILVNYPLEAVQQLPPDPNSPYGIREMIFNFWSYQDGRPAHRGDDEFGLERLGYYGEMNPTIYNHILEYQWIELARLADKKADEGYMVTVSSDFSGDSSIGYPYHVQCIKLYKGIKVWNEYDLNLCADIEDFPTIVNNIRETGLFIHIRFIGSNKILLVGDHVLRGNLLNYPIEPPINESSMPEIGMSMALKIGPVEIFTDNTCAINELTLDYIKKKYGVSLDNYLPSTIRSNIRETHKQFNPKLLTDELEYKLLKLRLVLQRTKKISHSFLRNDKTKFHGLDHPLNHIFPPHISSDMTSGVTGFDPF